MKKIIKNISNILIGIIAVIYLCMIILNIFLNINKNEQGYIEIKNNIIVTLKKDIKNYDAGTLLILENINLDKLTNEEIIINRDKELMLTTKNNITPQDKVIGIKINSYKNLGKIVEVLSSKYLLYIFILIPGLFLLIYELFTLLSNIKNNYRETKNKEDFIINLDNIKENEELSKTAHKLFEQKDLFNTGAICKIVEDKSDNANDLIKEIKKLNSKKTKKKNKIYQN